MWDCIHLARFKGELFCIPCLSFWYCTEYKAQRCWLLIAETSVVPFGQWWKRFAEALAERLRPAVWLVHTGALSACADAADSPTQHRATGTRLPAQHPAPAQLAELRRGCCCPWEAVQQDRVSCSPPTASASHSFVTCISAQDCESSELQPGRLLLALPLQLHYTSASNRMQHRYGISVSGPKQKKVSFGLPVIASHLAPTDCSLIRFSSFISCKKENLVPSVSSRLMHLQGAALLLKPVSLF